MLATAVPKGDRFDWLVEKATELGVERLIPIVTERSVVVPRGSKLDRLRRSIIEASKQCRRARLMELAEPMDWPELVSHFPACDPVPRRSARASLAARWPAIRRGASGRAGRGARGRLHGRRDGAGRRQPAGCRSGWA